jgi:hypothetical protein
MEGIEFRRAGRLTSSAAAEYTSVPPGSDRTAGVSFAGSIVLTPSCVPPKSRPPAGSTASPSSMLRLKSKYERRTEHRNHCRSGRRSCAGQHAYRVGGWPSAHRERACAPGRRGAVYGEWPPWQARSSRPLSTDKQGRHRYFRLSGSDVASVLEGLMGLAARTGQVPVRTGPKDLALRRVRVATITLLANTASGCSIACKRKVSSSATEVR